MTPQIIAKVEALGGMPYGQTVRIPHGKTYRKGEPLYWPAWLAYNESKKRANLDNKQAYHWPVSQDQALYSQEGRRLANTARQEVLTYLAHNGPSTTADIKANCKILSSYENTIPALRSRGLIVRAASDKGFAVWRLAK